jgi:hypothetical protein
MAKLYKIHPAIGIARVGDSSEHFVGPEIPGVPASPPDGNFKQHGKIKRQAARFRVYEYEDTDPTVPPIEINSSTAQVRHIEWTVHVANRKAVWYKFQGTTGEDSNYPPNSRRNRHIASAPATPADIESGDRKKLIIDPLPRSIHGNNQQAEIGKGGSGGVENWPAPFVNGRKIESLGTLYTDELGRLKVAGGYGISGTPDPGSMPSSNSDIRWDNNDNWFDDTSDGSVMAKIVFADGHIQPVQSPAWVITGVPDYAPPIQNIVSMYDVLRDLAIRQFAFDPAIFDQGAFRAGSSGYKPSYTKEIYPLLARAMDFRWVFAGINHASLSAHDVLGTLPAGDPGRLARRNIFRRLNNPESPAPFNDGMMPWLRGDNDAPTVLTLTRTQYFMMTQWRDGHFLGDWTGLPQPAAVASAEGLDIAALENCNGGGFYPGMEAGWIMRNASIYQSDRGPANLRLRHKTTDPQGVAPGDITKRMALPWQADFNACSGNWWPAQRPQEVRVANLTIPVEWSSPAGSNEGRLRNIEMVDGWKELGFVKGDRNGGAPLLESERNWPRR